MNYPETSATLAPNCVSLDFLLENWFAGSWYCNLHAWYSPESAHDDSIES